jgi:hypothetical protein
MIKFIIRAIWVSKSFHLEDFLIPSLEEEGPDDMVFQQVGETPHSTKKWRTY